MMTDDSKTQNEAAVKPQVIDLNAEDVTDIGNDAAPEATAAPSAPPPRRASRRGTYGGLLALLLAGAIGGGWLYRDVLSSYFPSSAVTELTNRMGALETNNKGLQDQLATLSAGVENNRTTFATLDQSVKDLSGAFNGTGGKFSALDQRLAALEKSVTSARSDLDSLRSAISAGGAGTGGTVDSAALAALGQRVDTLEKDLASLKAGSVPAGDAAAASALSQSLADLKAKVAGGSAYQAEYDRIARMVPAAPGLDVLATYAAIGLPNAQGLAKELRDLIPALPATAAPAPATEPSTWDWIWGSVTSVVTIRDIGEADWRALAEQAATTTDAGDISAAIAGIDAAEGGKPAGLTQWRDRAAARLKLEQAVEQTSGAVLRQITALGGAQ